MFIVVALPTGAPTIVHAAPPGRTLLKEVDAFRKHVFGDYVFDETSLEPAPTESADSDTGTDAQNAEKDDVARILACVISCKSLYKGIKKHGYAINTGEVSLVFDEARTFPPSILRIGKLEGPADVEVWADRETYQVVAVRWLGAQGLPVGLRFVYPDETTQTPTVVYTSSSGDIALTLTRNE